MLYFPFSDSASDPDQLFQVRSRTEGIEHEPAIPDNSDQEVTDGNFVLDMLSDISDGNLGDVSDEEFNIPEYRTVDNLTDDVLDGVPTEDGEQNAQFPDQDDDHDAAGREAHDIQDEGDDPELDFGMGNISSDEDEPPLDRQIIGEMFMEMTQKHPSTSKRCHAHVWKILQEVTRRLSPKLPVQTQAAIELQGYQTYMNIVKAMFPDLLVDYDVRNITDKKVHELRDQKSFPKSRFPAGQFEIIHEFSKLSVNDAVKFMLKKHGRDTSEKVQLIAGIDGVQESRSTNISLQICHLALLDCHRHPVPVVISRSKLSTKYVEPIVILEMVVKQIRDLGHKLYLIVADKPMRACILQQKQQGSPFPCEYCWLRSTVRDYPYKDRTRARHVYLYDQSCVPKTKANVVEHLRQMEGMTELQCKGYVGYSFLFNIPDFDPIIGVCAEYMHSICLGCIKKLLALTFNLGNVGGVVQRHLRVAQVDVAVLNNALATVHSVSEFNRRVRALDFANVKGEELRNFGLVYGFVIIVNLPGNGELAEIWKRFMFIFRAYVCLSDEELTKLKNKFDLRAFTLQFEKKYIQYFSSYHMVYNCHIIQHFEELRKAGPLTTTSAFACESMFGRFLQGITPGTFSIGTQGTERVLYNYNASHHRCQKKITFKERKRETKCDDSLVYIADESGYKVWQIISSNQAEKKAKCKRIKVKRYMARMPGVQGHELDFSDIGVYINLGVTDQEVEFSFNVFDGKCIKIKHLIVTLPRHVLLEST